MPEKLNGRVLVIGSLNVDFIIQAEIPKPGQTLLGEEFSKRAGGKGANQAVAASKISSQVWMAGNVGIDTEGNDLIKVFQDKGIPTDFIQKVVSHTGVAFVTIDRSGENAITVIPGANLTLNLDDIQLAIKSCKPDVILFQAETNLDVVAHVINDISIKAKKVLNLAPIQKLSPETLANVDVLIVNEHEATELLESPPIGDLVEYGEKLLNISKAAVLTLGADGIVLCEKGSIKILPALRVEKVLDTTGAGDGFAGSFGAFVASGFSYESASLKAIEFSGIAVSRYGGMESFPSITELS